MKKIKQILSLLIVVNTLLAQTPNQNITLASIKTYTNDLSNIHGYTDTTGREYALVGWYNGTSIVDVTNPSTPIQIAQISGQQSSWREIKTWGKYAYVTTEAGGGLQIINLSNLPGTSLPVTYWTPTISGQQLGSIHSLHIDNGKAYLYGSDVGNGGALIADISTNPIAPVYLGKYDSYYIHDGYVKNDTLYPAHINDGFFSIVDATNVASPIVLATKNTPNNFTHNTWLNQAGTHLFTTDEVNNSFLACYDITNTSNVTEVSRIQSQNPGSGSMVHNTQIIQKNGGEFAVTSWYKDGVVITDVTKPNNLVNIAWYDTYTQGSGGNSEGCWGVFPYLPSGNLIASDISNGLFVLSPTYIRACYLEGLVTDASTTNPILGASISIISTGINQTSTSLGNYATGYATAGSYSVTYAKAGYVSQTVVVTLNNGATTIQNIQLVPLTTFAKNGQVINSSTNLGVPYARVRLKSNTFTFDTLCDVNGNFNFNNLYADNYTFSAGKWLFKTNCISNQTVSGSVGSLSISIIPQIFDDFTFNLGWTVNSTATTGKWERAKPKGTLNGSTPANPNMDVNHDCDSLAFVTGNTGVTSSDDDVDNGYTVLSSPSFNLVGYTNPYIKYARWFFNSGGSGLPNDSLKIYINNGTQNYILETVTLSSINNSSWVEKNISLSGVTISSNMKLFVRTADVSPGNLVEAGFDHFSIIDSLTTTDIKNIATDTDNTISVFPNPSSTYFDVKITSNNDYKYATAILYNSLSQIVYSNYCNSNESIRVKNDFENGIYYLKITFDKGKTITKKVIIQK